MGRYTNAIERIRRGLLDTLYPQNNICHICGRALAHAGEVVLCSDCEERLLACRLNASEAASVHPPLEMCVSAYEYVDAARTLIRGLKFSGDRAACLPLTAGLCDAYADARELRGEYIVVPVPLHPKRLKERGFNQAALIAADFCAHTGLSMREDALIRAINTKPQSGKTRAQRLVGVTGAFRATGDMSGASVLLIDDVLTTGATLLSCAEALYMAGAKCVSALTVSRADASIQPD